MDIIAITETLPKNNILPVSKSTFDIPGYIHYTYAKENGRGVIIYIKKDIISYKVEFPNIDIESVWCKIKLQEKDSLLFGCVYRSPNLNQNTICKLGKLIQKSTSIGSHLCIVGDFNFKEIDWVNSIAKVNEKNPAHLFLEIIRDNFLTQHVNRPTHYRQGMKPSLLDLILTNEENKYDQQSCSFTGTREK